MWLEVDQSSFEVKQEGLILRPVLGGGDLYVSPGQENLSTVKGLVDANNAQAIEVNRRSQKVSFGRDYLGHYPMLYAHTREKLFISDEVARVREWLNKNGEIVTLAEEAIGLYFAMGYVPQGMTLHNEIKTCRNASLYHWKEGQVTHESTFKVVTPDVNFPLTELGVRIDSELEKIARMGKPVDVWCSGGLDSSIVAVRFSKRGSRADLLTLTYDEEIQSDQGELRFARVMAEFINANIRNAKLTRENYCSTFNECAATHIGPVVDYLVPLKYALAGATREIAVTGEGGDPLFSGAKNNFILYLKNRRPELSMGRIHAMAHKRLYHFMPDILKQGKELSDFVESYLANILDSYPGDLLRKLFYVNTFEKQGGMIFPKNYYAGKHYRVQIFHPLTSLDVYHAAFSLPDDRKYVYPIGKLALIELYENELPSAIIERKKSGTRLPLDVYVNYLIDNGANLDVLREFGIFNEEKLEQLLISEPKQRGELVLLYGLLSLSAWIKNNKGGEKPQKPIR